VGQQSALKIMMTAECEVIFPHEIDDIIDSLQDENMKIALILAFYCGLRCEEVCYLTVAGALDEYRLLIGRSKLASSRRTFPYGLFVPEPYMECLREIIQKRLDAGATWLARIFHELHFRDGFWDISEVMAFFPVISGERMDDFRRI